jgi:hypothetical protein
MITAMTTFVLPKPITREEAKNIFLSTAPNYRGVPGLFGKTYVFSEDGATVGGIYFWNSRPEAEAMFTEAWRAVTYFESPVVVDNVKNEIISD